MAMIKSEKEVSCARQPGILLKYCPFSAYDRHTVRSS